MKKAETILRGAVERCLARPKRRELIYSSNFQRSQFLFRQAPEGVVARQTERSWTFPNGSTLWFAHHDGTADRFKSHQYSYIDYDPENLPLSPEVADTLRRRLVPR